MLKDLKVTVAIDIKPLADNIYAMVQCIMEIPEKDPFSKEKPMLFIEGKPIITTIALSDWELYDEITKTIADLFVVLSKKIEQFKLYGRKIE